MRIFESRYDCDYQDCLCELLDVDSLLETSFPVVSPRVRGDTEYGRCCRIDYMGLSATTLLDIACHYHTSDAVPRKFARLFEVADALNEAGIFVKIRFLFVYPYAAAFFPLIQAESSIHRAAVDSPSFLRDFRTVDEVDEEMYYGSATVLNLRYCLEHLQELVETHRWDNDDLPNTVRVRFTPVDTRFSLLVINHSLFYNPYMFSKDKRLSRRLALRGPVVQVDREKSQTSFHHFEDHFRYLWDLDTTLVCEDATHYQSGRTRSLARVKPPGQVTYDAKGARIAELMAEQSGGHSRDSEIQSWKFRLGHMLRRFSSDTKPTPRIECAFIACSWQVGPDGRARPNEYAQQLFEWLESDFGSRSQNPAMSVHVLEAAFGGSLAAQVYARLREATLAIILLTADIRTEDGTYLTKPNVVHELGYLMSQLDPPRLIVLRQENVNVPSNISDNVYIDLQTEKLALSYRDVVIWLGETCRLVSKSSVMDCLQNHIERLDQLVVNGEVDQQAAAEAKQHIDEDLARLDTL